MEGTGQKIQIPGGGCEACGKFEGEEQDFLHQVLARDEEGNWLCAECLAKKVCEYFEELSEMKCKMDRYTHREKVMINGVSYDTEDSELLVESTTECEHPLFNSQNDQELWRTKGGKYFLYQSFGNWENIEPIDDAQANEILEYAEEDQ